MKILELSPYVYISNIRQMQRNQTGFGIMVWNICRALAAHKHDVHLFTFAPTPASISLNNVRIFENNLSKNFISFWRSSPIYCIQTIKGLNYTFEKRVKILRHLAHYAQVLNLCRLEKPDVIHIHGASISTLPFIRAAIDSQIPFVVTLHGNSLFDDNCRLSEQERSRMLEILGTLSRKAAAITCVSTGTRKDILHLLKSLDPNKVLFIPNGIDRSLFKPNTKTNREKKILLAGSLTKRKNHIFMLQALVALRSLTSEKIKCVFAGEGPERPKLEKYIKENRLKNIKLLGTCSQEELVWHYSTSWLTVVVSTSEGFGLPIIESYACGTPVISFDDLDAIADTFHKDAMIKVTERNPHIFAQKLLEGLSKKWDANLITQIATKWDLKNIAKEYINLFESTSQRSNIDV